MNRDRFPRRWCGYRCYVLATACLCAGATEMIAQTNYQQLAFFGPAQGLGVNPQALLGLGPDNTLFGVSTAGTLSGRGGVFRLATDGSSRALLRAFGSDTNADASSSIAGLARGTDGTLYGVTEAGGDLANGALFKLNPVDRGFQVIYSFGTVTNDGYNLVAAPVIGKDGALYGTTEDGGIARSGIVFKVNPDGTGYRILHQFGVPPTDAANPISPMIVAPDGTLYGTTVNGGASNTYAGALFKLSPDGTSYAVLHSFSFGEGYNPRTSPLLATDGVLYGTTAYGGTYDGGIVYRLSTNGTGYQVVYNFPRTDLSNTGQVVLPSSLIQGVDGALYGATTYGGLTNATATNGLGTVFKIDASGSNYTVLHLFNGEDGRNPQSGVVSGSDGVLYGTTPNGGYADAGVVFKLAFSPPPRVVPIDLQVSAAGAQLTYSGAPGQAWAIQSTTNLALTNGWQMVATATTDTNGLFQVNDANLVGSPARFYRAFTP